MNASFAPFITLEGIEGTGKSTNLNYIQTLFEQAGHTVAVTREPGGTPLAEEIRELLLRPRDESFSSTAELLLMFAARAQHIDTLIRPLLAKGTTVISDRFTDATYAYQGGGRGLPMQQIAQLEILVQQGFAPDLTVILTIDPEMGMSRARKRGALDRFETEKMAFYERVQACYLERAALRPDRYSVIDAAAPLDAVQAAIRTALKDRAYI
ncbi:MAG: dTMP kinase [Hahellaceae bacterium]|nr:dTMP kinase [Hahellaceae bacterium]